MPRAGIPEQFSGLLRIQSSVSLHDRPRSRSALSRIKSEKTLRLRGLRCSGTRPEDLTVTKTSLTEGKEQTKAETDTVSDSHR